MGTLTYLHNFSINLKLFQNKGLFVRKEKIMMQYSLKEIFLKYILYLKNQVMTQFSRLVSESEGRGVPPLCPGMSRAEDGA